MTAEPLVVVDADVLGRSRTGDETYTENLLAALAPLAEGIRVAAVTRHPEIVPPGIWPVHLPAGSQELRMAWSLPRLLTRLRPALGHFQYTLPLGLRPPAVLTVHDLSFERDPTLMGRRDRLTFRTMVPRAVRRAERVFAVSERTRLDLIELYGTPPDKIVVTPNGVDPAFSPRRAPGEEEGEPYLLFVGAIQERKDPLAAADAAAAVGLPLVVAGPKKEPSLARELERRGARVLGYVSKAELATLYRGASALLLPSRFEGFGLPVLEAMASGTPVVAAPEPALREVAGDAALYAERGELADAVRRALAERDALRAAGLERAKAFSWRETARRTVAAYKEVLGLS
ncbi:MAG TPA: glycosyltransferase family 1 protein [Gaiellaceae bacterium]|nr:glycosyltransferase family 1 protein [Gaiellaceae bacterium]